MIQNIEDLWWKEFITKKSNIVSLDSKILLNNKVWEAFGHVLNFIDLLIENKVNKKCYRVDINRKGIFELKSIKKNQTSINQIERKIIFMYSKGLSNRDISDVIDEIYGFRLNANTISKIIDKIMLEIEEFHARRLDKMYATIFNI